MPSGCFWLLQQQSPATSNDTLASNALLCAQHLVADSSGNVQALWSGVYATCVHWQDCLCAPASEDFVL